MTPPCGCQDPIVFGHHRLYCLIYRQPHPIGCWCAQCRPIYGTPL